MIATSNSIPTAMEDPTENATKAAITTWMAARTYKARTDSRSRAAASSAVSTLNDQNGIRVVIERSPRALLPAQSWVKGVAQAVAEEVEGQAGQGQGQARERA